MFVCVFKLQSIPGRNEKSLFLSLLKDPPGCRMVLIVGRLFFATLVLLRFVKSISVPKERKSAHTDAQ